MEIKRSYTISKRKTSKNSTLADEIAGWLHAESSYALIMKLIKEKGYECCYWKYSEMKKQGDRDKNHFIGGMLKQTILWKSVDNSKEGRKE
jgi:hypothetical protein